ncbi:MAG: hypothetical protein ACLFOY_15845 [Desulfatibacillaceae bacterium]
MSMPKDESLKEMANAWSAYLNALEKSLDNLDAEINDAMATEKKCTGEWCTAVEHFIDELANSLYSIHEPRFTSEAESAKLKDMKRRVHDLYAEYKSAAAK